MLSYLVLTPSSLFCYFSYYYFIIYFTFFVGIDGWSGLQDSYSRIDDTYLPSVQHLNLSVSPYPDSWILIGQVNVQYNSTYIVVSGVVTSVISRGDSILVGEETFIVSSTAMYDSQGVNTTIPLARPYLGM